MQFSKGAPLARGIWKHPAKLSIYHSPSNPRLSDPNRNAGVGPDQTRRDPGLAQQAWPWGGQLRKITLPGKNKKTFQTYNTPW